MRESLHPIIQLQYTNHYNGKSYTSVQQNSLIHEFWALNRNKITAADVDKLQSLCLSKINRSDIERLYDKRTKMLIEECVRSSVEFWLNQRSLQAKYEYIDGVYIDIEYDERAGVVTLKPNKRLQALLICGYSISMMTTPFLRDLVEPAFETFMQTYDPTKANEHAQLQRLSSIGYPGSL